MNGAQGVTLRFSDHELLDEDMAALLVGPGGVFELADFDVLGVPVPCFVQRPANLRESLVRAATDRADVVHLVDDTVELTFAQVAGRVAAVAATLAERGVRHGDRVALAGANSIDHVVVLWAVIASGAVAVELNGWWTAAEMEHGIGLTSPVLVVGDEQRLDRLRGLSCALPPLVRFADLVAAAAGSAGVDLPDVPVAEDDPAAIMFTSGTTGRPRGATLSHRNVVHCGYVNMLGGAVNHLVGGAPTPDGQPATVLGSPLFHVSGTVPLLSNGPSSGIKVVLPPPGRWDPITDLELTQRHRITSWSGVPTLFVRLLEHPDLHRYDLSSVRTVGIGGAPLPPDLERLVAEHLPDARLTSGYGMTETTGTATWLSGRRLATHPGSVGGVTPGQEVQVRDAEGRVCGPGEIGEITVRGAGVFLGYWGDPGATASALDDRRWYRTGDFGRIEDDVLYLESRMRDLIIRGGENVYPIEIEHRLCRHPQIDEAAVVGVDHRELGQEVKAVVVLRPGSALSADQVRAWVGEELAPFKVPSLVEFRDALPTNATGKVLKQQLV